MRAFIIIAAAIAFARCSQPPAGEKAPPVGDSTASGLTAWTETVKASILADFKKGIDSTSFNPIQNGNFFEVLRFRNGMLKQKQYLSRDSLTIYELFYAGPAGEFELRHKYCPNGQMAFEGITVHEEPCGMNMWWHCNGQVEHKGLRYRSKYFGKWPYWQEDGTLDHEDNFGLMDYLDSLNTIQFPADY
ncbi:MAG: hypothetical protein EPO28_02490 [Saprospiraceae bacterium]|nr:MAG: hypothetical protein EPO28_02490 [Saprospiraceae bacterium]